MKRRVCIGLTETAGVAAGLADGFAALGWRPSVVLTHRHPMGYPQPHRRFVRLTDAIRTVSSGMPPRLVPVGRVLSVPLRAVLFLACLATHDTFVFLSRTRFVSYLELAVLRLFRKQVIQILLGSDARPPYMDGNLMRESWGRTPEDCKALLDDTCNALRLIERWSSLIVSHPPYAQLQTRRAAHVLAVGLPVRLTLTEHAAGPRARHDGDPIVLHSPSSPEVKGTHLVREAVEALRSQGYRIDYREIMNADNATVLAALRGADLVIDQCYSDTPLAMFATEAAVMGCPVIVGGYAWDEIRRSVPADVIAPTITCLPEDLTETLRRALDDRDGTEAVGRELQRYVTRLEPTAVTERLLALLDGSAPDSWWFDPRAVTYDAGCGLDIERAKKLGAEVAALA